MNEIEYYVFDQSKNRVGFLDIVSKVNRRYKDVKTPEIPEYNIGKAKVLFALDRFHNGLAIATISGWHDDIITSKSDLEKNLAIKLSPTLENGNKKS